MNKKETELFFFSNIRDAFTPKSDLSVSEWAKENIVIGGWSAITGKFDPSFTPWIVEPLNALQNPDISRVTIISCTGGSKSTIGETFLCWLIVNDPAPVIWNCPTEKDAKKFSKTRIQRVLEACEPVRKFIPSDRSENTDLLIKFPHMDLFIQGANETSAQWKHVRYEINDETWLWDAGMLLQMERRTDSFRHNRKILDLATGPFEGESDETMAQFNKGTKREWLFKCPKCNEFHKPIWQAKDSRGGVKWDRAAKKEDGSWNYKEVEQTVYYECPNCLAKFKPTSENGYKLNKNGKYSEPNKEAVVGHESYHWDVIAARFNSLPAIAVDFLGALEAYRKTDDIERYARWQQTQMGLQWGRYLIPRTKRVQQSIVGDYSLGDKWEECQAKIMTIDIQRIGDEKPFIVRGYKQDFESRPLEIGIAHSYDELRHIQAKHGIPDHLVFIDSGHDAETVYTNCSKYGWTPIKGQNPSGNKYDGYLDIIDGVEFVVPYKWSDGVFRPTILPTDRTCESFNLLFISEPMTAEKLHYFRCGLGKGWSIANNMSETYMNDLNGFSKAELTNPKTRKVNWAKAGGKHNFWDLERIQIAAAYVCQLLEPVPVAPVANNAPSNTAV